MKGVKVFLAIAFVTMMSGISLVWTQVKVQQKEQLAWSKREEALRQRCVELQRHIDLESFFMTVTKARDAKGKPINGVAEVETTDAVTRMYVHGLIESPKRQLRAGDRFRILDRHYSIDYHVVEVNDSCLVIAFDARMSGSGDNWFAPEFGSRAGRVELPYKRPYSSNLM